MTRPSVSLQPLAGVTAGQLVTFARVWCRWPHDSGPVEVESLWAWDDAQPVCASLSVRTYSEPAGPDSRVRLYEQQRPAVGHVPNDGPIRVHMAARERHPLRLTAKAGRVPVAQVQRVHERHLREELPHIARSYAASMRLSAGKKWLAEVEAWLREVERGSTALARTRPAGRVDGPDLALVARLFREAAKMDAHDTGDGRQQYRPSEWVRVELPKHAPPDNPHRYGDGKTWGPTPATVRSWIRRARQRGYLRPIPHGTTRPNQPPKETP